MSNEYIIIGGELYHYGIPGMKWGERKAYKYANKAKVSRESAKEWEQMAKDAERKGNIKKASKYRQYAKDDLRDADSYDRDASREAKSKAKIARESAKEWEEMAKYAEERGKTKRAAKYRQYAKDDMRDAEALNKYIKDGKTKANKVISKSGKQKVSEIKKKKQTVDSGEKRSMSAMQVIGANAIRVAEFQVMDRAPVAYGAVKLANWFSS